MPGMRAFFVAFLVTTCAAFAQEPLAAPATSSPWKMRYLFDENDSVLYFDSVKVPWSRVFVHNDVAMASAQWHSMPTHVYQNYQCQIRLMVKMLPLPWSEV